VLNLSVLGLATAATQAGVSERVIAKRTGYKSLPVLHSCIREESLFTRMQRQMLGYNICM
jgi:hypothetical protein